MTTATHNGTCQACGRKHAYSRFGIAKHGYTTEYGFFNGTCQGSDHLPLELSTELNERTVDGLRRFADELDAQADGAIDKVPVERREYDARGKRVTVRVLVDREGLKAHNAWADWERTVEQHRMVLRRQAENIRKDADELEQLRTKVLGQPLQERQVEEALHRESFKFYRQAYARVAELKAEGNTSARQRRSPYGGGFVVTWRG